MVSVTIALVAILLAIVLFGIAAASSPPLDIWRTRMIAAGLAALAIAELIWRGLAK